jgi:hypothetical protein
MPGEGDDGVGKMHPKPGLAKCPQNAINLVQVLQISLRAISVGSKAPIHEAVSGVTHHHQLQYHREQQQPLRRFQTSQSISGTPMRASQAPPAPASSCLASA